MSKGTVQDALSEALIYQRLVEGITDYAIYMLNPDGVVNSWNPGAERFKGYKREEIIGQHFGAFYTQQDRARGLPAKTLEIASREGRFEAEAWRVRKNGERFRAHVAIDAIHDEAGVLVGFAKITRDVSDTYEQQKLLREGEQRFRLLVSGVTDYAIYLLDMDGMVSSWNAGAQRFKGYAEQEILGQHFSKFYLPDDVATSKPQRALSIALSQGRFEDRAWRLRKDGSRFWAHVVLDLIRDEAGEPIGFAKITRDISDQHEAEARMLSLRSVNQELQQFVQVASHDLREPLRKILAFSDLLAMEASEMLGDEQQGYLKTIVSATQRMQALLDSLLRLTKVSSHGGSFETCDLRQQVQDAVADLELLCEEKQAQFDIGTLPEIDGDRAQLRQLFQNLIGNALKYSKSEVAPHIRIYEVKTEDPDILTLEVADNGLGFEPQYREQIFGIFQRLFTRDEYEGSGVGLSVCRKICERHGGSISADGELDKGATFRIQLARSRAAAEVENS